MGVCIRCGNKSAEYERDFLVVSKERVGGCLIKETLSGVRKLAICRSCLSKLAPDDNATKRNIAWLAGGFAFILGSALAFDADMPQNSRTVGLCSLVFGVLLVLLGFYFVILMRNPARNAQRLEKQAGKMILSSRKDAGGDPGGDAYMEVGPYMPVGWEAFFVANLTNVSEGMCRQIYDGLISNGDWKEYVAAELSRESREAASAQMANVPEGEHTQLLIECVRELLRLYRQTPGGFLTDSAAAQPVRAIGKKLDAAGGFELMLQAHGAFSASSPGMGLARNLEMVWDGIGGWRG